MFLTIYFFANFFNFTSFSKHISTFYFLQFPGKLVALALGHLRGAVSSLNVKVESNNSLVLIAQDKLGNIHIYLYIKKNLCSIYSNILGVKVGQAIWNCCMHASVHAHIICYLFLRLFYESDQFKLFNYNWKKRSNVTDCLQYCVCIFSFLYCGSLSALSLTLILSLSGKFWICHFFTELMSELWIYLTSQVKEDSSSGSLLHDKLFHHITLKSCRRTKHLLWDTVHEVLQ